MPKPNYDNQGYLDRLQRAESWISRAKNLKEQEWDDYHGPFIFYWIAFNALYGRHHETRMGEKDDLDWFLGRICELDQEDASLSQMLSGSKQKTDRLLKDHFLSEMYWKKGPSSPNFKQSQDKDFEEAQEAYAKGKLAGYLTILLGRFRVLRNQIFHGCSTDRRSLNKNSLRPAMEILEDLVPLFLEIFKAHGQRYDWPKVPYPRKGSPQHPK